MTVENFVVGFALLLVSALVAMALRSEPGRIFIAVCSTLIGAFGLGYFIGGEDARSAYWKKIFEIGRGHFALNDAKALQDVIGRMTESEVVAGMPFWPYMVCAVLLGGGLMTLNVLVMEFLKKQRLNARQPAKRKPAKKADQKAADKASKP